MATLKDEELEKLARKQNRQKRGRAKMKVTGKQNLKLQKIIAKKAFKSKPEGKA